MNFNPCVHCHIIKSLAISSLHVPHPEKYASSYDGKIFDILKTRELFFLDLKIWRLKCIGKYKETKNTFKLIDKSMRRGM